MHNKEIILEASQVFAHEALADLILISFAHGVRTSVSPQNKITTWGIVGDSNFLSYFFKARYTNINVCMFIFDFWIHVLGLLRT